MNKSKNIVLGLLLFNGVSAIGGGIALISGLTNQTEWIKNTNFSSLYFPGVILMAIVGGSSLVAALALMKKITEWQLASILAGVIMLVWIVGEIASIRTFHFLQVIYFASGIMVICCTSKDKSST